MAIFYDIVTIKQLYPSIVSAYDFVKEYLIKCSSEIDSFIKNDQSNIITIPVLYNGEDLESVAALHQISKEELIELHTAVNYHVYMTGFLPGFAYMGTVNKKIATPRKEQPRLKVTAGSVGIAGEQTGIYPVDSPGGWQIIGSTPLKIFDSKKDNTCLINAGDTVQFISINQQQFQGLNEY